MKNNSYWEKRLANDLWNTYNDTSKYQKELIEIYKKATDEILEELYRIASKYEENGVISRSEFYKAEHLKRMEKGFNYVLKGLGEKIENKGSKIILNAGEDVVKKTGKSLGIDINYNEDLAKKLMQTEWKGSNFSKRIWRNSKKLERELNTQVKKGILTGKPTAQIAMELNKSMGSGLSNSARLIRTETMHHMNDINLAHMKDSGISKVKEIVTLDERTSSTCKVHNNKIHDIDKSPILPRHPNCRCVLVPYIDVDELHNRETLSEDISKKENTITSATTGYNISYKEVDSDIEKELQKRSDKLWNKKFLGSEKNALYEYSGTDYGIINRYLENRLFDDDDIEWNQTPQKIKELDRALSRSTLGDDLVLHRGVSFREFETWRNSDTIKAYKSTSINENILNVFGDGYHIIIRAPKDTKGFYLGNYSEYKLEKEFLMMRNQKYRILSINESVMEVEFYG